MTKTTTLHEMGAAIADDLIAAKDAIRSARLHLTNLTNPLLESSKALTKPSPLLFDTQQPAEGVTQEDFDAAWAAVEQAANAKDALVRLLTIADAAINDVWDGTMPLDPL